MSPQTSSRVDVHPRTPGLDNLRIPERDVPKTIRIAVVDDADGRAQWSEVFARDSEFKLSACYANAQEAVEKLPQSDADVVFLNMHMPRMSGIECLRHLRCAASRLKVVMLLGAPQELLCFEALLAGASGYLTRPASAAEYRRAASEAVLFGITLSKPLVRQLAEIIRRLGAGASPGSGVELTPREQQCMACILAGKSDKEIAEHLQVGLGTVHSHLHNLFTKLGVTSRAEAAKKYLGFA